MLRAAVPVLLAWSACAPTVMAASRHTRVTAANVGTLPVTIDVEVRGQGPALDSKWFIVTVRGKDRPLSPFLVSQLTIRDGEAEVASCSVERRAADGGGVRCEFYVDEKYLAKSRFMVGELGHVGGQAMPSGDFYWFYLEDLVPKEPVGKQPAGKGGE